MRGPAERDLGCSEHLRERLTLVPGDLLDPQSLRAAVQQGAPQEIYHLAAPSFVPDSWQHPEQTMRAIAGATGALLEAVRDVDPATRVYVPASGAIFGDAGVWPPARGHSLPSRDAIRRCQARGPPAGRGDACARGSVGVLGDRLQPRVRAPPAQFVTRRITRGAPRSRWGGAAELTVGDLDAVRDWSFAGDVVRGAG